MIHVAGKQIIKEIQRFWISRGLSIDFGCFLGILRLLCNVNRRKILSAHKNHVRETSLFTGAIPD